MIVLYFYIAHLLVKDNYAYKYLHSPSHSYVYRAHGRLHNYAASISEMPYHVLIVYSNLYCSGTLIRSRVVVTVASCFIKWNDQRIVVKVGADTVTGMGQVVEVVAVKKHEYFGHASFVDNDIALVMLKNHVTFNQNIRKIIMIEPEMALRVGTALEVSGWASPTFDNPKYANSLLWSEMVVLDPDECMKHFPNFMTYSNFCARYSPEHRISDTGGPAVFREVLVGILSYGADSTVEPFIAVFTNVSFFHRWINLNTRRFMKKYCFKPVEYYVEHNLNSEPNDLW